jgi:hypothetical protein
MRRCLFFGYRRFSSLLGILMAVCLILEFLRLQSLVRTEASYQNSYSIVEAQVQAALKSVPANQMTVTDGLDLLTSLEGRFRNLNQTKRSIIEKRFSIQRQIGTLFESINETVLRKRLLN